MRGDAGPSRRVGVGITHATGRAGGAERGVPLVVVVGAWRTRLAASGVRVDVAEGRRTLYVFGVGGEREREDGDEDEEGEEEGKEDVMERLRTGHDVVGLWLGWVRC